MDTSSHESMLTGLTDPFSDESARARYPDSGSGKSLTFQQRYTFPMTTSAGGGFFCVVTPKFNFPLLVFASISGSVATWPATYSAFGDSTGNLLLAYGKTARLTSIGVRICNTLSATDSAGYIIIAKGGPPAVSGTTTFSPTNFTNWDDHPYGQGQEWHSVAAPRGGGAYNLTPFTSAVLNTDAPLEGWENIYIGVLGTKISASIGVLDMVFNYEYIPAEDAAIAQLAEKQPILNIGMQTAINEVQSAHLASHKGGGHVVKAFIKKEGKKALLKHVLPFVQKNAVKALAM